MTITKDLLESMRAKDEDIEQFCEIYPSGKAEIMGIICNPKISYSMLHWIRQSFGVSKLTEDELKAYQTRCRIADDCAAVYCSNCVEASYAVMQSSNVTKSVGVFWSDYVDDSGTIARSNRIKNSTMVFDSDCVHFSDHIIDATNISNSSYVSHSKFVMDSKYITFGNGIINSKFVRGDGEHLPAEDIEDSLFIHRGKHLRNCLFCSRIEEASNMLFNKPAKEKIITWVKSQLEDLLAAASLNYADWPDSEEIDPSTPSVNPPIVRYDSLPDEFWRYIKTLPGYDSDIIFSLTFHYE